MVKFKKKNYRFYGQMIKIPFLRLANLTIPIQVRWGPPGCILTKGGMTIERLGCRLGKYVISSGSNDPSP